jgi:hypothetical protein
MAPFPPGRRPRGEIEFDPLILLTLAQRTLGEERYAGVREAFFTWLRRVLLPGRFPGLELPEGLSLAEDEAMLAERVKEWTRVWREEGLKQGLEQGIERGLEQGLERGREEGLAAERRMLLRLIDRRFGSATAQAAEPLLAQLTRPDALEPIAEWVIDARDAEDFLSRLRAPAP